MASKSKRRDLLGFGIVIVFLGGYVMATVIPPWYGFGILLFGILVGYYGSKK